MEGISCIGRAESILGVGGEVDNGAKEQLKPIQTSISRSRPDVITKSAELTTRHSQIHSS